jgi:hypothetical protein
MANQPTITAKEIRGGINLALDQIVQAKTVPNWVVNSIRARTPQLAEFAVRNRSLAAQGFQSRRFRSSRNLPRMNFDSKDLDAAVRAVVESLVIRAAQNGRSATEDLLRSAMWWRALPCCSQFPMIWPLCRTNC